jgi:hypothetical protein
MPVARPEHTSDARKSTWTIWLGGQRRPVISVAGGDLLPRGGESHPGGEQVEEAGQRQGPDLRAL